MKIIDSIQLFLALIFVITVGLGVFSVIERSMMFWGGVIPCILGIDLWFIKKWFGAEENEPDEKYGLLKDIVVFAIINLMFPLAFIDFLK